MIAPEELNLSRKMNQLPHKAPSGRSPFGERCHPDGAFELLLHPFFYADLASLRLLFLMRSTCIYTRIEEDIEVLGVYATVLCGCKPKKMVVMAKKQRKSKLSRRHALHWKQWSVLLLLLLLFLSMVLVLSC